MFWGAEVAFRVQYYTVQPIALPGSQVMPLFFSCASTALLTILLQECTLIGLDWLMVCGAGIASRVQYGQQTFLRFPENLLNSRARYTKAFQVSFHVHMITSQPCVMTAINPEYHLGTTSVPKW